MMTQVFLFLLVFLLSVYLLLTKNASKRLPPGSLGLPIIGQSLSFLSAMRKNTAEEWLQDRIRKYGPISKMSILGAPTLFIHGQAANKFVFSCDSNTLDSQQPSSISRVCGERNILELSGHDHKRVRGALLSFLKPEVLKQYVSKMDEEIRKHFEMHWHGKKTVLAMPSIKTLTFNIMSSLIIGIEQSAKRDMLLQLFQQLMEGILSVPFNFPFTRFNRSLQTSGKIRQILEDLIREKRAALEHGTAFPQQDLITTLLSLRNEENSAVLTDGEIIDNAIVIMIAGYDTSSVLLSLLIRLLADDPSIYASILQEQAEISKNKASGELLTWDDLTRMKHTWSVALETLRMTPPVFSMFRKVLKDIEYEGYLIPKGWQVMLSTSMTHMDDSIFPHASRFDPERFQNKASVPPYSFLSFGGGARICPGYEFARLETLITIHYLVNRFIWKLCHPGISFSREPFPLFKDGLEIEIEPRTPL
ncbi:hypothetical protein POPTR_004G017700v4 [Populus trichocarpa]|uniref:Cytochrome P450 n=1 Tax=Populus trichocarpa TaxID=3694 RepID=B9H1D4_POPTR|nr:cytochrome P450 716B1-like [Populus trichocarpa]PNT39107.1 hypothetical protein POPTR_004G017700v4 [Populus trichocarpa]|eukprot:XP_002304920.1 cytochrome P450 716B1 [Populus trichocarpa]